MYLRVMRNQKQKWGRAPITETFRRLCQRRKVRQPALKKKKDGNNSATSLSSSRPIPRLFREGRKKRKVFCHAEAICRQHCPTLHYATCSHRDEVQFLLSPYSKPRSAGEKAVSFTMIAQNARSGDLNKHVFPDPQSNFCPVATEVSPFAFPRL